MKERSGPFVRALVAGLFCALGAGCASNETTAPASQPQHRVVFAAPFENVTNDKQYDPAAAGMGDLVAVLLAQQESVRVVERQRLDDLTEEQARSLAGLTGPAYAVRAGNLLQADTVLAGRLFLLHGKLTISTQAIDVATERVVAADQISCRPADLAETALQTARKLAEQMAIPLPEVNLAELDKTPIASLHFAHALGHYYAGDLDAAIVEFMRTMDLDPDFIEAHYWMGVCYQRLGEDDHAVIEWEQLLKRHPDPRKFADVLKLLDEARERLKASTVPSLGPKTEPAEPSNQNTSRGSTQ